MNAAKKSIATTDLSMNGRFAETAIRQHHFQGLPCIREGFFVARAGAHRPIKAEGWVHRVIR